MPYVDELTTKTRVTRRIREFVEDGGKFLGICAGAYFGSETVRFDSGGAMQVEGKRDLVGVSCIAEGFRAESSELLSRRMRRPDISRVPLRLGDRLESRQPDREW